MLTYEVISNKNCNLECYFCFAGSNLQKSCEVMSFEIFKKGMDEFLELSTERNDNHIFVKIYGGESLLYPEIINSYLEYIDDCIIQYPLKKITAAIITNGTILTECVMNMINKFKHFMHITISFEGSEFLQNSIRTFKGGAKSFDLVYNNILKIYNKTGKRVNIQSVLSPDLLNNIESYIEFMENHKKIMYFGFVPMMDDTFENQDDKILRNISILFDYYIKCINENNYSHISLYQPARTIIRFFLNRINVPVSSCAAGSNTFALDSEGSKYPCTRFLHSNEKKYVISDINKQRNKYSFLTKVVDNCKQCQRINKFGCLGSCLFEVINNNIILGESIICKYNVEIGQQSLRLFHETKKTDTFVEFIKMIFANQNSNKDLELQLKEFIEEMV